MQEHLVLSPSLPFSHQAPSHVLVIYTQQPNSKVMEY